MLKKIISFLAAIAVLCSVTAVAALPEKLKGIACEEELLLLNDLELLPPKFLDDFKPNKSMKRGDFASLICSYMGIDKIAGGALSKSQFTDVKEYDSNYASILAVSKYGIMTGDGYGNFNPEGVVTYAQVIKVIMSVLGYDELAAAYGGYPYGYIAAASGADITDGISIGDYNGDAKSGDVVVILANALDVKMLEYAAIGNGSVSLSTDADKTILSIYHRLETYTGRVNGIYGKQALDVEPIGSNDILIGNTIYKISSGKSFDEYFGFDVTFYYNIDSKAVTAVKSGAEDNKKITVKSKDIIKLENNTVTYYDGDKEKRIRLDVETDIVYNGRLHSGYSADDFTRSGTSIDFIDAGADGVVDIVSISHIQNYVVKSVNAAEKIVYDMYGAGTFKVANTDNLVFKDQLGNNMEFEELSQYDVISVVKSNDGLITSIIYSNTETEGTVEAINSADASVVIDGNAYCIAANLASHHSFSLGQTGLFVLDINGDIAAYKPYQSSYKLAYFMDAYTSKELDGTTYVKLLTEDNELTAFRVADKFIGDGVSLNSKDAIALLSANGEINPQIIRFYLTKGEVKSIDTIKVTDGDFDDTLELMYSGSSLIYNGYQSVLGAKVPISAGTAVFVIPEDKSDEERYSVYNKSAFIHDRKYNVDAYCVKAGGHMADAVVMVGNVSAIESSTPVFLIEGISRVVDEDGSNTARIYGYSDGRWVSYLTKDEAVIDNLQSISDSTKTHNLVCGDVVKLAFDNITGRVNEIELYYERENEYIKSNMAVGSNLTSSDRMLKANVYSMQDGIVRLTQDSLSSSGIRLTMDEMESIAAGSYDIYSYSVENGKPKVCLASTTDIIDYCSSETDFSKVLMFSAYANPGTIIIYNN